MKQKEKWNENIQKLNKARNALKKHLGGSIYPVNCIQHMIEALLELNHVEHYIPSPEEFEEYMKFRNELGAER